MLAYQQLSNLCSSHVGQHYVRRLLDSFDLVRPNGNRHHCLVHPPLHTTLWDFQRLGGKSTALPEDLVKVEMHYLLQALDFLHTEAQIIHCDLKLSNIMLTIEDLGVLSDFEEAEKTDACPWKVISEELLCDLGEARTGSHHSYQGIQPELYRAPEIVMQKDWSYGVDIWNLACLAWEMLENKHLFNARDEGGNHNNRFHVGKMIDYLGPPPAEFQQCSANTHQVFDEQGKWRNQPPLSPNSLEDLEQHLEGASKAAFLGFMRSMMTWLPEQRKTAKELLKDPWLNDDV